MTTFPMGVAVAGHEAALELASEQGVGGGRSLATLYPVQIEPIVQAALAEDLGRAGDVTSDAVVPVDATAVARIRARRAGCIAGTQVAVATFRALDPDVDLRIVRGDGAAVSPGATVLEIRGNARAVLAAERTALNLLGHLSGIATVTADVVRRIAGTGARVVCTRKTTPMLRALEKHAVRCGGGANHRFGLDDAVLIKDNHRAIAGGAAEAVRRARRHAGHLVKIEVEIDDLDELAAVIDLGVDAVLLDNMAPETLRRAVAIIDGRAIAEASGGITPDTALAVAETGVDLLSIGWLTHSAPSLDLGLDFEVS